MPNRNICKLEGPSLQARIIVCRKFRVYDMIRANLLLRTHFSELNPNLTCNQERHTEIASAARHLGAVGAVVIIT